MGQRPIDQTRMPPPAPPPKRYSSISEFYIQPTRPWPRPYSPTKREMREAKNKLIEKYHDEFLGWCEITEKGDNAWKQDDFIKNFLGINPFDYLEIKAAT